MLILSLLSWLLYASFFLAYPLYQSTQAVRKPLRATLTHWLLYWIAFGGFLFADSVFEGFFLYDAARNFGLLAMLSPTVSAKFRSYVLLGLARDVDKHLANTGLLDMLAQQKASLLERADALPLYKNTVVPAIAWLRGFLKDTAAEAEEAVEAAEASKKSE